MKSVHIAGAAIGVTIATLGCVAAFAPSADRIVGTSYDRAFASRATEGVKHASPHSGGSEDYWLTTGGMSNNNGNVIAAVALAGSDAPSIEAIKSAIVTTGAFGTAKMDIVNIQPVARAAIGANLPAGKSFLVTARFEASNTQPARVINVVVDVGADAGHDKARAL